MSQLPPTCVTCELSVVQFLRSETETNGYSNRSRGGGRLRHAQRNQDVEKGFLPARLLGHRGSLVVAALPLSRPSHPDFADLVGDVDHLAARKPVDFRGIGHEGCVETQGYSLHPAQA